MIHGALFTTAGSRRVQLRISHLRAVPGDNQRRRRMVPAEYDVCPAARAASALPRLSVLKRRAALGQLEDQARRGRVTPRFGRSTAFYLPRAGDRKRQDAANIRVPRNSAAPTPIVVKSRPNSQRKQTGGSA